MDGFTLLVVMAMLATVVALGLGVTSMVRGGEFDRAHSGQFMVWRVGLQGLAFLLLGLALLAAYG